MGEKRKSVSLKEACDIAQSARAESEAARESAFDMGAGTIELRESGKSREDRCFDLLNAIAEKPFALAEKFENIERDIVDSVDRMYSEIEKKK
jgi:hypothetical protein